MVIPADPKSSSSSSSSRGKVKLSSLIAASIHLSDLAAHEILDVKSAG